MEHADRQADGQDHVLSQAAALTKNTLKFFGCSRVSGKVASPRLIYLMLFLVAVTDLNANCVCANYLIMLEIMVEMAMAMVC